jgi:phage shock protein PspC (stress-responsive transcriptional regulator)
MCGGPEARTLGAMTDTTFATPRLERPRDAAFKGVATALARATNTDVVLWRVLFVVLSFFGGLGIVLYLLGIVAIPEEGEERAIADRLLHGPDRHLRTGSLILVILLVAFTFGLLSDTDGALAAIVLGGLAFLWWRSRTERAAVAPPAPAAAAGDGTTAVGPPVRTPPAPAPRRPRSPLGGLTVSLAGLAAGVLVLLGATGAASVPVEVVLAAALATVGAGLVVGAFFGRAPGLTALAVLLSLALGATAAVRPAIDAGVGDRTWTPTASASYRLGVGEGTLDLRSLPATGDPVALKARVDVGHLLVLLPDRLRVTVDARAGIGDVQVFGTETSGRRAVQHVDLGPPGGRRVTLDLSVRTGVVEVRRG